MAVDGRNSKKLFKRWFSLDVWKFTFRNRIADKCNSLSDKSVAFCTLNSFEMHIIAELEPETT